MPAHLGGLLPDHPSKIEKVKLHISRDLFYKGKDYIQDVTGRTHTDSELNNAQILGGALPLSSVSLATPTPMNQGNEGSCAACATAYGARSIEYYYKTGASSYSNSVNVFSPEYVYDYVKFSDCGTGTSWQMCLDLMVNKGVCLWNTLPYSDTNGCAVTVASPFDAAASSYKIGAYAKIMAIDRAAIKTQLANNHPVMASITADNNFIAATSGFIWSAANHGAGALPHAICFVGYDDSKNAYKVMNSWGTGWCESGFGWIDYNFYESGAINGYYVYVITDAIPVSNTAPIANAGFDVTIPSTSSATLDGTSSSDPDGYIASYAWTQVSGANTATITNATSAVATASGMIAGTYVFRLTVTDNSSATATDTVTVTVKDAVIESFTLTVTKSFTKGKTYDLLTWNIVTFDSPVSAELQYGINNIDFTTLFPITPFSFTGSYTNLASSKIRRYYRLKVVRADGTINYSSIVSIK